MKKLKRKKLPATPYVSLAEALTWIAFEDAMAQNELLSELEGQRPPNTDGAEERLRKCFSGADNETPDVPGFGHFEDREQGLKRLSEAWRTLRDEVERGTINLRGRFTSTYLLEDAHLALREELTEDLLATFSQFDVSTGGIRRQPQGSPDVLWQHHVHSYDREMEAWARDDRAADGYLMVQVERVGLLGKGSVARLRRAHLWSTISGLHDSYDRSQEEEVPENRQLDHSQIISEARKMRKVQPKITIGSAAASIVEGLPPNPKTGKSRDTRHIERLIAHLWEGGGF